MANQSPTTPINPVALPLHDAAKLLSRVGSRPVSEAVLHADVDSGAPTNADGTLNLVHYAAWLLREASRGD